MVGSIGFVCPPAMRPCFTGTLGSVRGEHARASRRRFVAFQSCALGPHVREQLARVVGLGSDALVVGAGRGGRVAAVAEGARSRRACSLLVLVPEEGDARRAANEVSNAWDEMTGFVLSASPFDDANVPARARSSATSAVCGTVGGVADAFFAPGSSAEWLKSVEILVLFDVLCLDSESDYKALRKLLRITTLGERTQVVAVVDEHASLLKCRTLSDVLRKDNYATIEWKVSEDAIGRSNIIPERYGSVMPRRLVPALFELLTVPSSRPSGSTIPRTVVFFQSAGIAQWFADVFGNLGIDLVVVHSGKSTVHNRRSLFDFRTCACSTLFTTGEVSRGAVMVDVARIVQVGLPSGPEQYTARMECASKGSTSVSLLLGYEVDEFFSRSLMISMSEGRARASELTNLGSVGDTVGFLQELRFARSGVEDRVISAAYASWLRIHISLMEDLGWSPEYLVRRGWQWIRDVAGKDCPPALPARIVDGMNLRGVPGMVIDDGPDSEEQRKSRSQRDPDIHGKFKKRIPRGRLYYGAARETRPR